MVVGFCLLVATYYGLHTQRELVVVERDRWRVGGFHSSTYTKRQITDKGSNFEAKRAKSIFG